MKRKQGEKAGLAGRGRAPYLLPTIPLSKRALSVSTVRWYHLALHTGHRRASSPTFCSLFLAPARPAEKPREEASCSEAEDRSVEHRWAVESLNHGVVQWLQGRRKPRVGCTGQNGPSSTGILSAVQRTPSVALFFVVLGYHEQQHRIDDNHHEAQEARRSADTGDRSLGSIRGM